MTGRPSAQAVSGYWFRVQAETANSTASRVEVLIRLRRRILPFVPAVISAPILQSCAQMYLPEGKGQAESPDRMGRVTPKE
jgi:hypothetical protein